MGSMRTSLTIIKKCVKLIETRLSFVIMYNKEFVVLKTV